MEELDPNLVKELTSRGINLADYLASEAPKVAHDICVSAQISMWMWLVVGIISFSAFILLLVLSVKWGFSTKDNEGPSLQGILFILSCFVLLCCLINAPKSVYNGLRAKYAPREYVTSWILDKTKGK